MSEFYRGIIIGGPKDGECIECVNPFFESIEAKGVDDLYAGTIETKRVTYKYRDFHVTDNGQRFGIWVIEDMSRDDVMQKLIDGYRRPRIDG